MALARSPIMLLIAVLAALLSGFALVMVQGHGSLIDPAQRSSMWRYSYPEAVQNTEDHALWCGGKERQFNGINHGLCGECGDEWSIPRPRYNDEGGKYGQNIIAKTYSSGSEVNFTVDISSSHGGYFEFRLCAKRSANELVEQNCLDQTLLETTYGTTRVNEDHGEKKWVYVMPFKLPDGLTCDFCVLQWTWVAANSLGTCANGTSALGCGNQETYKNCADISIH